MLPVQILTLSSLMAMYVIFSRWSQSAGRGDRQWHQARRGDAPCIAAKFYEFMLFSVVDLEPCLCFHHMEKKLLRMCVLYLRLEKELQRVDPW